MKRWALLLVALATLFAVGAQANRFGSLDSMLGNIETLGEGLTEQLTGRLGEAWVRGNSNKKKHGDEEMAMIVIRFVVPPSKKDDFIDRWEKLAEEVEDEKGNRKFELGKTLIDNIVFTAYGEWESWEDFMKHCDSKHHKEWLSFLEDNKIIFTWRPVTAPAKDVQHKHKHSAEKGEEHAHVLIRFVIEPGLHSDFIDTWQEVADAVDDKEDQNIAYNLRKMETNNYEFLVCGSWETFEDYVDHMKSDHVRKLIEFSKNNDIAWFLAPVKKYGSEEEKPETH